MKVLFIDDYFVTRARNLKKYSVNQKESEDRISFIYRAMSEVSQQTHFDLTEEYHSAGGSTNIEFLILTEPKVAEHIYVKDEKFLSALSDTFNIPQMIEKIEKINPDVIFLDMGIQFNPKNYLNIYKSAYEESIKNSYEIDTSYDRKIVVPFKYLVPESVHLFKAGGIFAGFELKNKGIKFSFWTGDYGHSVENMSIAATLNLLSSDSIIEATRAYKNAKPIHFSEDSTFHKSMRNYIFPVIASASDTQGSFFIGGKQDIFGYNKTKEDLGCVEIEKLFVPYFEQAILKGFEYQNKKNIW